MEGVICGMIFTSKRQASAQGRDLTGNEFPEGMHLIDPAFFLAGLKATLKFYGQDYTLTAI